MAELRATLMLLGACLACLSGRSALAEPVEPALQQDSSVWFDAPAEPVPVSGDADGLVTTDGSVDGDAYDTSPADDDTDPRALSDFSPLLEPYGEWHQDARFGLVWVPSRRVVGDRFAPYVTHGSWGLDTNGDWVWLSDFAFGPVVFHYGRWVWVAGVGWAWVPGYRYAPAWVVWRVPSRGFAYVGWAPMPPSYIWMDGMAVGLGFHVTTPWIFCPSQYVFSPHPYRHRVRGRHNIERVARYTDPYHPSDSQHAPTPQQAGVPSGLAPKMRVPPSQVLRPGSPPIRARMHAGVSASERDLAGYLEGRQRSLKPAAGAVRVATRQRDTRRPPVRTPQAEAKGVDGRRLLPVQPPASEQRPVRIAPAAQAFSERRPEALSRRQPLPTPLVQPPIPLVQPPRNVPQQVRPAPVKQVPQRAPEVPPPASPKPPPLVVSPAESSASRVAPRSHAPAVRARPAPPVKRPSPVKRPLPLKRPSASKR